jgi:AcrR family transcriptional regulator
MVQSNSRLNKDSWLALALEVLSQEGRAKIQIEYLALRLGVTKGSFYAHFSGRREFIASVAAYWADTLTVNTLKKFSAEDGKAEEGLLLLMQAIKNSQLEKYDLVMRAWALDEPLVAKQVEKVDQLRFEYIKSLFSKMGFKGAELEMRSMIFQTYHSLSNALQGTLFEENRYKHENLRHQFFIQKMD